MYGKAYGDIYMNVLCKTVNVCKNMMQGKIKRNKLYI